MNVMADGGSYQVDPSEGRYAALYMRYMSRYAYGFDTPEEAAMFLDNGEDYGEMSSIGIYDTQASVMVADKEKYKETYSWTQTVALEVPVHTVSTDQ